MSYLEEWNNIEQMIKNHDISKSTIVPPDKRQALALMHIAKCLSVFADDIANAHTNVDSIRRCGECVYQGDTEHCASCQIIFNATGFEKKIEEATDDKNKKVNYCEDCLYCDRSIHQKPCLSCDMYGSNFKFKKATDEKPCNNCIHSNEEDELNCGVCDENHSEYKPFGFRGKNEEIEVRCPSCGEIITVRKTSDILLALKCPTCNNDFTYNISTNIREWRI